MIVQELLKQTDIEALADIYESGLEDYERDIMEDREAFTEHMTEFVRMLLTLTPNENIDEDKEYRGGYVMAPMPYLYIDDEDGNEEVRIEASLIRKDDWVRCLDEVRNIDVMPEIDPETAEEEEREEYLAKIERLVPQVWAYTFSPWEEILSAEIVQGSFDDRKDAAGKELQDKFLYSLLWEMSFNGYTREHQEERKAELHKSIKEMDYVMTLPEEEQKNYFHDAEDVFKDLYAEMGEEYQPPTEEEQEETRRRIIREIMFTQNLRLKEVQKFAK